MMSLPMDVLTSSSTVMNPQVTQGIHDVLYSLLQVSLLALVGGITWATKLAINSMNSGWKQAVAQRLVKWAQMKIPDNSGKYTSASEKLHKIMPRLGTDEIENLIEEAVFNLKAQTPTTTVNLPVVNIATDPSIKP